MGTSTQIRNYRIRAGKSAADVAKQLGLNDAWYYDLEHNDDELTATLTLFQAMELASALGVRLHALLPVEALPDEKIALIDLPSRIEAHVARNGMSVEQLEKQVGCDLRDFLESPVKAAAESPISFLQALAAHLGIHWLSLVPDEDAG